MIHCGIKKVWLGGNQVLAGYLHGLRVYGAFKQLGLAEYLCRRAEELAEGRGIRFLYLSVNSNNNIAVHLYRKLGYREADLRSMKIALNPNTRIMKWLKKFQEDAPVFSQMKKKFKVVTVMREERELIEYYLSNVSGLLK